MHDDYGAHSIVIDVKGKGFQAYTFTPYLGANYPMKINKEQAKDSIESVRRKICGQYKIIKDYIQSSKKTI